jgi:hypothetical protein
VGPIRVAAVTAVLTVNVRSNRPGVRNPVLVLPAMATLRALSPECRRALRAVLLDLAADARHRAEVCWRRHKAPMAAYWKATAVYAGHIARALR